MIVCKLAIDRAAGEAGSSGEGGAASAAAGNSSRIAAKIAAERINLNNHFTVTKLVRCIDDLALAELKYLFPASNVDSGDRSDVGHILAIA